MLSGSDLVPHASTRAEKVIEMCRRECAGEHPLEVLYQARDAVWQAASQAHYTEIPPTERASYEHALSGLLQAVGTLSELCQLPTYSAVRAEQTGEADSSDAVIEPVGPPDVGHPD